MRTPDEYAKDWNIQDQSGDSRRNASGASTEGVDNQSGNPYRWDAPVSPSWGLGPKGATSFGHSDDVENVNLAKDAGKDLLRDGYERGTSDGEGSVLGTRQPGGSFPASIPDKNVHNRAQDDIGEGHDISTPGKEQLGSSKLIG